jgi:hypothetical protein
LDTWKVIFENLLGEQGYDVRKINDLRIFPAGIKSSSLETGKLRTDIQNIIGVSHE